MWAFAHSSRLQRQTAVRLRPHWGWRACRWASLRRFLTVCAEILWLCKPIVAAAVRLSGVRPSWRFWAGVVTRGLRLWGRLDVPPNCLKHLWRWHIVEKWTFNSRATALVDIPCQLHAPSLATSVALCCDKTEHFRVAFYCGQFLHGQHTHRTCHPLSMSSYTTACSSSCQHPATWHSHWI